MTDSSIIIVCGDLQQHYPQAQNHTTLFLCRHDYSVRLLWSSDRTFMIRTYTYNYAHIIIHLYMNPQHYCFICLHIVIEDAVFCLRIPNEVELRLDHLWIIAQGSLLILLPNLPGIQFQYTSDAVMGLADTDLAPVTCSKQLVGRISQVLKRDGKTFAIQLKCPSNGRFLLIPCQPG